MKPKIEVIKGIILIPVEDGILHTFASANEKREFLTLRTGIREVHENYCILYTYRLIDPSSSGFVITPRVSITRDEAIEVIKHYL